MAHLVFDATTKSRIIRNLYVFYKINTPDAHPKYILNNFIYCFSGSYLHVYNIFTDKYTKINIREACRSEGYPWESHVVLNNCDSDKNSIFGKLLKQNKLIEFSLDTFKLIDVFEIKSSSEQDLYRLYKNHTIFNTVISNKTNSIHIKKIDQKNIFIYYENYFIVLSLKYSYSGHNYYYIDISIFDKLTKEFNDKVMEINILFENICIDKYENNILLFYFNISINKYCFQIINPFTLEILKYYEFNNKYFPYLYYTSAHVVSNKLILKQSNTCCFDVFTIYSNKFEWIAAVIRATL